jgi:hypothetical protein
MALGNSPNRLLPMTQSLKASIFISWMQQGETNSKWGVGFRPVLSQSTSEAIVDASLSASSRKMESLKSP